MLIIKCIVFSVVLCLTFIFGFLTKSLIRNDSRCDIIQKSKIFLCKKDIVHYNSRNDCFNNNFSIHYKEETRKLEPKYSEYNDSVSKVIKYKPTIKDNIFILIDEISKPYLNYSLYNSFLNNEYVRFLSFANQENNINIMNLYLLKCKLIKLLDNILVCKSQNFYEKQLNLLCFIDNFLKHITGGNATFSDLIPVYELIRKASFTNIQFKVYINLNFDDKNQLFCDYFLHKENASTTFTIEDISENKYIYYDDFCENKNINELNKLVCTL